MKIALEEARVLPFWELVRRRTVLSPDREMLVDEFDRSMTFTQFSDAAESFAGYLHDQGVGQTSTVAWQLPTTVESLIVIAALTRLGARQCPIIPMFREREVGFMARQSDADLLIVPKRWRGFEHGSMARKISERTGCEVLTLDGGDDENPGAFDLPAGDATRLPEPPTLDGRVRWIYYTSGTTSDPKGVRHTDRSVISSSTHLVDGIGCLPDDMLTFVSPVAHVGGVMTLTAQLLIGFRLYLVPLFDPVMTPQRAVGRPISVLRVPGPVASTFLDAQESAGNDRLYPGLRMCQVGGASKPAKLNERVRALIGFAGALSSYGMTECPAVSTTNPADPIEAIEQTSGRLNPGVEVRVVDEAGAECPLGLEGELRVRGPQLFSGYVNSDLDHEAFDEQGFFRTGDLGVLGSDGFLRVTGRIKDIIIRNGENISAQEVEDALGTDPAIADIAVIGLPDERTGERCCAVVQLAEGIPPMDLAHLATRCERLGLAKQKVPEQIVFVDSIPRNALGKIQKAALRAQLAEAHSSSPPSDRPPRPVIE